MSEILPQQTSAGSEVWARRYSGVVMNTFGAPQRVLVRGEGAWVWDADGRRYLDLLGGIAVNALGHAHPTLVAAVSAQLGTLGHVSNFFATPTQVTLAEQLLELSFTGPVPAGSTVFLANSGTEAVEAAIKIARRHGGPRRPRVIALEQAFHGRTLGALSLTHKEAYRTPFEPLPGPVTHVPAGDVVALEEALKPGDVSAVVIEPIQGEAGVLPLPPGYLAEVRRLTRSHGALLILDEIQTGVGRTGAWLAHHHDHIGGGVVPDVITFAKGLGGGVPIGAVVAVGEHVGSLLGPGQHGTTFGGNPVASAAALATLHVLRRDDLIAAAARRGEQLRTGVDHRLVAEVRGEGLLLALALRRPIAGHVVKAALQAGFIVNAVAPDAIRLSPPLVLTAEQVEGFLDALPGILDAAAETAEHEERSAAAAEHTGGDR